MLALMLWIAPASQAQMAPATAASSMDAPSRMELFLSGQADGGDWGTSTAEGEGQNPPQNSPAANGFWEKWFARVNKAQGEQPHWITPVATTTPRLEEEFRYDIGWNQSPSGILSENYGGSKGLELIPAERVEIILSPPPYIAHDQAGVEDGFGDVSFLVKFRAFAGNEQHGNYILTFFLGATAPTGEGKNGALDATITPTIAAGKGFGNFDIQSTFGATLPTGDTNIIGRTLAWNTTFQYHIDHYFWPEVETNAFFFVDGPSDGKKQTFITPGIVLGRFHLWHRLGLTVGGGFQIAATQYYKSNHNGIFSVRFPF
jgi:hypothetical protein